MNLKKQFDIVFQPNTTLLYDRRRFLVSINKLHLYIGHKNANKAILKALNNKSDSLRLKYRKFGIIDIYNK